MVYTPYDWTENLEHRQEYVEDRLREGSPVAGVSYDNGVMLLTVRRGQEKIFEIYDRLIFSGLGHQSDLEALRLAAVDFAHREGFARSEEDVSAQRVVGVALSPVLKRGFGDMLAAPLIVRGIFAEVGERAEEDVFYTIDFDGEFEKSGSFGAVAGSKPAEAKMAERLGQAMEGAGGRLSLEGAIKAALETWVRGRQSSRTAEKPEPEERHHTAAWGEVLRSELESGKVEAAVLERETPRSNRFRRLEAAEIGPLVDEVIAAG